VRVLIVVHGFPPQAQGGTEIYSHGLATALAARFGDDVSVLAREHVSSAPEYRVRDEHIGRLRIRWINNTFRETRSFEETYHNPVIAELAANFIDSVRPDIAHVHHLTCLSTTILDELKRRRIPVVLTLHDYWLLCHRGQLLDVNLHRCPGPVPEGCDGCTSYTGAPSATLRRTAPIVRRVEAHMPSTLGIAMRRTAEAVATATSDHGRARRESAARIRHMRERWDAVTVALAPSRHVRDRFVQAGFPADKIRVSENGIERSPLCRPAHALDSPLRLTYLGSLMVSKAPHLILEAIRLLPAGSVSLNLYGAPADYHGDGSYSSTLSRLLPQDGVASHAPVSHGAVRGILAATDVLIFPSIWEETSGLVAREALVAGVPVIASRIGAIPESVMDGINGLLFEPGNAADLAHAIQRLLDEPQLLERLRAAPIAIRDFEEDLTATRDLYAELTSGAFTLSRDADVDAREAERVFAIVLNYRTADETLLAVRALLASKRPFDGVVVVDNDTDHTLEPTLREFHERVTVISSGANLGFSGGMNVGIREARRCGATHVLLVNSDAVLPPSTLGTLLDAMRERPNSGIVGPVVLARSQPDTIATAGITFSPVTGRMRHPESGLSFAATPRAIWKEVSGVSGCAMLIADAVFERIGLLPEPYFFSFEDLAFCLSARDAGFGVGICGNALAYHEGSRTLGAASARRLYFGTRNQLLLSAERPAAGVLHRFARAGAIIAFNALYALRTTGESVTSRLSAVARGTRDHLTRRYGSDQADR
jgi:GT2 family glycosyltransferase/glycosyltransferase involved in cell wall biosynthesis